MDICSLPIPGADALALYLGARAAEDSLPQLFSNEELRSYKLDTVASIRKYLLLLLLLLFGMDMK